MSTLAAEYDEATANTEATMAASLDPAERVRAAADEAWALAELRAGDPAAAAALDADMAAAEGLPDADAAALEWSGPDEAEAMGAFLAAHDGPDAELEMEAG